MSLLPYHVPGTFTDFCFPCALRFAYKNWTG